MLQHVYLLSPANCNGRRGAMLRRPEAASALAQRLRAGSLTLGEAFAFISGLYFRGKLTYATARCLAGGTGTACLVITPTRGLQAPETLISPDLLDEFAGTDIASGDARFTVPLARDLAALAARLAPEARVVLLGSIASDKYVTLLASAFGPRLHYPPSFIGRGDMSRGGLLLRAAAAGEVLEYAPLAPDAVRRGARPPKLPPQR